MLVDGRPLGEWLDTTQVFPDLTLENHGFWDIPYQVSFATISEPIAVWLMCDKKVPEAYWLHAHEEGQEVLRWLLLPDGDLLCPHGFDWAERDVQHQWAFTELGLLADMPWARAAEARCLRLLLQRQAAFHDGSLHALDFAYQTDLANCWAFSYLLHKYLDNGDAPLDVHCEEQLGSKIFPYVGVGVYRTPDLVSSISWYGPRQLILVVPNNFAALGDHPSLTAYRGNLGEGQISGIGYLRLQGERGLAKIHVDGDPKISTDHEALFGQLSEDDSPRRPADGRVLRCRAARWWCRCAGKLDDIRVQELADHTFYWVDIPGWLPKRMARQTEPGVWNVDDKLQLRVLGETKGAPTKSGIVGARRAISQPTRAT